MLKFQMGEKKYNLHHMVADDAHLIQVIHKRAPRNVNRKAKTKIDQNTKSYIDMHIKFRLQKNEANEALVVAYLAIASRSRTRL